MIIRDLEVLEVVSEETDVKGGTAFADARSYAYASGRYFAATNTSTSTGAYTSYYYYYGPNSSANSSSSSSSVAY